LNKKVRQTTSLKLSWPTHNNHLAIIIVQVLSQKVKEVGVDEHKNPLELSHALGFLPFLTG